MTTVILTFERVRVERATAVRRLTATAATRATGRQAAAVAAAAQHYSTLALLLLPQQRRNDTNGERDRETDLTCPPPVSYTHLTLPTNREV